MREHLRVYNFSAESNPRPSKQENSTGTSLKLKDSEGSQVENMWVTSTRSALYWSSGFHRNMQIRKRT